MKACPRSGSRRRPDWATRGETGRANTDRLGPDCRSAPSAMTMSSSERNAASSGSWVTSTVARPVSRCSRRSSRRSSRRTGTSSAEKGSSSSSTCGERAQHLRRARRVGAGRRRARRGAGPRDRRELQVREPVRGELGRQAPRANIRWRQTVSSREEREALGHVADAAALDRRCRAPPRRRTRRGRGRVRRGRPGIGAAPTCPSPTDPAPRGAPRPSRGPARGGSRRDGDRRQSARDATGQAPASGAQRGSPNGSRWWARGFG